MNLYLVGSLAFDELGLYEGDFSKLFKKEYLKNLSVSFVVQNTARFFGGCAGNVAYSLGLLGIPANICTLLGKDGKFYKDSLKGCGMNTDYLEIVDGHTAHVMIASDLNGKQIAQFAPGVLGKGSKPFSLPKKAVAGDILLVGPENHDRMLEAVNAGHERNMKVFFDPGQMIHTFNKTELIDVFEKIDGIFVNDYEWELLKELSGVTEEKIFAKIPIVVVTKGREGVDYYYKGVKKSLAAVPAVQVDSTGAGDAFRAGVLAGLYKGLTLENSVKIGTILGAACVEYQKAQGHHITENQWLVLKKLGFE